MAPDLPVIQKSYDFLLWLVAHAIKFPRVHRFSVGDRLEKQMYGVLENLLRAKFTKNRAEFLQQANLDLEILRFQLRLARDLKCLSVDSYGYAANEVNGIGQMVGGWLKKSGRAGSL